MLDKKTAQGLAKRIKQQGTITPSIRTLTNLLVESGLDEPMVAAVETRMMGRRGKVTEEDMKANLQVGILAASHPEKSGILLKKVGFTTVLRDIVPRFPMKAYKNAEPYHLERMMAAYDYGKSRTKVITTDTIEAGKTDSALLTSVCSTLFSIAGEEDEAIGFALVRYGWDWWIHLHSMLEKFPYREYTFTKTKMRKRLSLSLEEDMKSSSTEDMRWMGDFISWIIKERPLLSSPLSNEWFDEYSSYPFEFMTQSYRIEEEVDENDYLRKVNAFSKELEQSQVDGIDIQKKILIDTLHPDANLSGYAKDRTVSSTSISRWDRVVDALLTLPKDLLDLMPKDDSARTNKSLRETSGFSIYAYAAASSWGSYSLRQRSEATIEYAHAATSSIDAMYRWLVWLRAQRAMEENKAYVILSKEKDMRNIIFSQPAFHHCPPELLAWLNTGKRPSVLTYGKVGKLMIPKDTLRRMGRYPSTYDEWKASEN